MSAFINTNDTKSNINYGSTISNTSISTASKSLTSNDSVKNMGNNVNKIDNVNKINKIDNDSTDEIIAKLNKLTKEQDIKEHPKFWSDDPNILLQKDYIFEFYPVDTMTYEQKLNAISRLVILVTVITFMLTKSLRILVISAITLFSIFILYFYQEKRLKKERKSPEIHEGFDEPGIAYLTQNNIPIPEHAFSKPSINNPFSNVMLPDYDYNPNKKPAPPAYSSDINQDILYNAKQLVIDSNPDQPDIADKIFKDLGDNLNFEQSLRPFNSNPSTTIPNDQAAFADFCYGSMVSCKEGNLFACARNLARHIN